MSIVYRDEMGIVVVEIEGTVSFLNGKALFTEANGKDVSIDIENLVMIGG